jgi:hypothetical protein
MRTEEERPVYMEKTEEEDITVNDWKCIVQRNLAFQRYVFRRSWGIYYGMLAAVTAVIIFLSWAGLGLIVGLTSGLTVIMVLIVSTLLLFRKSYRTVELRQSIRLERRSRRQRLLTWLCILTFFSSIIITPIFLPSYFSVILYATEIPFPFIILYYGLKLAFPEKIPIEGALVVMSYAFIVILSLVLSAIALATGVSTPILFPWIATVLLWFLASFYAILHARDELEGLVEE